MFLLDIHCRRKHSVYFVPLMPYLTSNICVTLKFGLGVVQGHRKWRRSIDHMRLSIGRPL